MQVFLLVIVFLITFSIISDWINPHPIVPKRAIDDMYYMQCARAGELIDQQLAYEAELFNSSTSAETVLLEAKIKLCRDTSIAIYTNLCTVYNIPKM